MLNRYKFDINVTRLRPFRLPFQFFPTRPCALLHPGSVLELEKRRHMPCHQHQTRQHQQKQIT